jgi:hypothetical protein
MPDGCRVRITLPYINYLLFDSDPLDRSFFISSRELSLSPMLNSSLIIITWLQESNALLTSMNTAQAIFLSLLSLLTSIISFCTALIVLWFFLNPY